MQDKLYDVFISYSSVDRESAFLLLEILEARGLRCWIAPRDIPQGAQWADEIDLAITRSRMFVVIVSAHSVESKQVPKELALAVTECFGIFPLRIDNTNLQGSFRYYLSSYQFVDATTAPKRKMEELADALVRALGTKQAEAAPDTDTNQTPAEGIPRSGGPAKKRKLPLIIGIAAVLVLALLAVVIGLRGKGTAPLQETMAAEQSVRESPDTSPAGETASPAPSPSPAPAAPEEEAAASVLEEETAEESEPFDTDTSSALYDDIRNAFSDGTNALYFSGRTLKKAGATTAREMQDRITSEMFDADEFGPDWVAFDSIPLTWEMVNALTLPKQTFTDLYFKHCHIDSETLDVLLKSGLSMGTIYFENCEIESATAPIANLTVDCLTFSETSMEDTDWIDRIHSLRELFVPRSVGNTTVKSGILNIEDLANLEFLQLRCMEVDSIRFPAESAISLYFLGPNQNVTSDRKEYLQAALDSGEIRLSPDTPSRLVFQDQVTYQFDPATSELTRTEDYRSDSED